MIKNKLTEVNVLVVYTYTLFDKIGEVVFFYAGVEQASKSSNDWNVFAISVKLSGRVGMPINFWGCGVSNT